MSLELIYALGLFALVGAMVVAYGIRIWFKGQLHFERIDKDGGSPLLGKGIMEMGYWFLQPLARLLIFCHITANQISWGSLFFGFLSGCSLAFGHFGSGAAFASVSSVMDSLDGIVARLTRQSSDAGEVLDAAVDRYTEFFFLAGLIIYYRELPALLILSLLALMGSFMVSYSTVKAEALQITPPRGNMRRPERAFYLIFGAALSPCTIPWLEASREYPIAIGHPMVIALCFVAVLSHFSAVERLWAVSKVIRERENQLKRTASASRKGSVTLSGDADSSDDQNSALRNSLN
jgi:CDP-diacylglycerol--glycerol-3-phosphate 3-phosphatidyltransferase